MCRRFLVRNFYYILIIMTCLCAIKLNLREETVKYKRQILSQIYSSSGSGWFYVQNCLMIHFITMRNDRDSLIEERFSRGKATCRLKGEHSREGWEYKRHLLVFGTNKSIYRKDLQKITSKARGYFTRGVILYDLVIGRELRLPNKLPILNYSRIPVGVLNSPLISRSILEQEHRRCRVAILTDCTTKYRQ